jgi:cystinosin
MNHVTRSTKGWSIGNVLLDVVGGVLSISQSVLDSVVSNDWSVLLGNPIRFAIGFYSIFFDCIFMLQHFIWFPEGDQQLRRVKQKDGDEDTTDSVEQQGSSVRTDDEHV